MTAPEDSGPLDLLGDPMREPDETRGRPAITITQEMRKRVSILRAAGMEYSDIAAVLGHSESWLRTHFLHELRFGAAMRRAEVIESTYGAALKGNVAAQKAFLALGEKADAMPPLPPERPVDQEGAEDAPEKLGKKAQADKDAMTAHEDDAEWANLLH
jgi:hypothetical protein